jgi:hypothetical protein
MGEGQDSDLNRMLRRFDKGDRSPEVLAALNQAAFQAFHAPWEKGPRSKPTPPLPAASNLLAEVEVPAPEVSDEPLQVFMAALRARGLTPYHAGTGHLVVPFPFDPKADAHRSWKVRVRPGTRSLQLISSSDAPLNGYSEAALERLCKEFSEDEGVTTAKVYRKHPSASLRVHVINAIPARVAQDPLALDFHLAMVLCEDQAFWRLLRRERPL